MVVDSRYTIPVFMTSLDKHSLTTSTIPHKQILALESCAWRSLPAFEEEMLDGWRLRYAEGTKGRANSVYPLAQGEMNFAEKVRYCEAWYDARELVPRFKLTDASIPSELDNYLEARGYERFSETQVHTLDLDKLEAHDSSVTIEPALTEQWLSHYLANTTPHEARVYTTILRRIELPTLYAQLKQNDDVVALGRAVIDRHWVGLFGIWTQPEHRKRGYGKLITLALLHEAKRQGATQSYLQVVANNQPAIRLYQQLGFRYAYPYWYRRKVQKS